jgi:DNA-binding SARP family transcriptional activator
MARAAAKRNRSPKPPAGRQPRPSRSARKAARPVEDTLFFTRLRRNARWVFALLAVAFAGGFVFLGVGSGSTGIGDLFNNFRWFGGGSSGSSISKAQALVDKNPKNAAAYLDLARAYQAKSQDIPAITSYESYVKLRPRDTGALSALAGLYENRLRLYSQAATDVQQSEQSSQLAQGFGPSAASPLGQALADPIQNALSSTAPSAAYQQFAALAQQASQNVENTYRRLASADPSEPTYLIRYAQFAQSLGDTTPAIAAYTKFLKKFPEDPNVRYAQKQLKALTGKSAPSSSG